ncbi:MAG: MGH1-like glycoside hydrolase domain-containing protein [Terrimicrobiaceae bacterium]
MNSLESYFLKEISTILRPPQGCLKYPYFVPGGIFHDELWDWDSFWIAKGLIFLSKAAPPDMAETFLRHAKGSWINFFLNQAPNGTVPTMVKSDNSDVFQCSNLRGRNQAKPVFGQFALAITGRTDEAGWVAPYLDGLMRFYGRWMAEYGTESGLLVWGCDVAIGVDNDPTTYGRPEFSSANLLLNCLFYQDVLAARELATMLGRDHDAQALQQWANRVGEAVQRECWDEIDGFFYTVDVQSADHRGKYLPGLKPGMDISWETLPLKIKMFTGFLPMWCGIASDEQARRLVEEHLRNEKEFCAPWGLRSMSESERMYEPATDSANPSNWLGPVWIVASYMVYEALIRYGYHADADELANKTRAVLENDLQKTGALHECYHPDTGAPNFNAGFLSWNVLALLMK